MTYSKRVLTVGLIVLLAGTAGAADSRKGETIQFDVPVKVDKIVPPEGFTLAVMCSVSKGGGGQGEKTVASMFSSPSSNGVGRGHTPINLSNGSYQGTVTVHVKAYDGKYLAEAEQYGCSLGYLNPSNQNQMDVGGGVHAPKPGAPLVLSVGGTLP